MKRTNKIKTYLACVLAVAIVIIMAVSPAPACALSYGDPAATQFDPKEGPDLSHSNCINVPKDGNRITYATGRAGHPLTEASNPNGTTVENLGSGDRPVPPTFDADLGWPGYIFGG